MEHANGALHDCLRSIVSLAVPRISHDVRGRPSLPSGSEGPAKVQTARRALTPNPAFAVAQKVRFDAPRFLCTCLRPVVALSRHTDTTCFLSAFGAKRTYAVVRLRPSRS